jgi:hypothetical protein
VTKRASYVAGFTALALGVLALVAYVGMGWSGMDSACSQDAAVPPGVDGGSVQYGWSWSPPGFQCEWPSEDGGSVTVTKLWW